MEGRVWLPTPQNRDTLRRGVREESPGGLVRKPRVASTLDHIPWAANKWLSQGLHLVLGKSQALPPGFCQA